MATDSLTGAPDLWEEVVGQEAAVAQLRAAVESPVHAYLLVGPPGSGRRAAARAFAADLLTRGLDPEQVERGRRLVAMEAHPSLTVVERVGQAISAEEAREVVRVANMAPPEGEVQVLMLLDVHLLREAGPILLKSVEEPPPGTIFVLVSEELPVELATIESRCVRIDLNPVPAERIVDRLVAEGVDRECAELAAASAGGDLARARLLARDDHLAARRELWSSAPDRLDGTGAAISEVVEELIASIDEVVEPLQAQQAEELEELTERLETYGRVTKAATETVTARHKREQRRVRTDEIMAGLRAVTDRYRRAMVEGGDPEAFIAAADAVQALCDDMRFNPNERLALLALFAALPPIQRRKRS